MSDENPIEKLLRRIPDSTPEGIKNALRDWKPQNMMRQMIGLRLDTLIETARTELETCDPRQLLLLQGKIKGINEARAAMNRETL